MPTTKRSPAPSPAKKTNVSAIAPKPEPASAQMPSPYKEWPSYFEKDDMTRTHEMIVEAVTEMLTTGGHEDDVDRLIYATMAHQRRRLFSCFRSPEPEAGESVKRFLATDFAKWKTDLMITWRKNEMPSQPHLEPKSITDRIRANFREMARGSFENFMSGASPEEIRLLWSVLDNWDGRHHAPEHGRDEIYIANAFLIEIDRGDLSHVRVPEHLVDRVQKYLDALRAIEDKAVA